MSGAPVVDWATITPRQAVGLRQRARNHERATGERFERGEVPESEFIAAMIAEEDLHIFILTGAKP